MKKSVIRSFLVILMGLLAFEFFLSQKNIEPYPAFYYPEFSEVVQSREEIEITKPVFTVTFADGASRQIDYYQLFGNVPISHVNHLVVNNLNPLRRVKPEEFQDKPFRKFNIGRYTVEWRRTPWLPGKEELEQRNRFLMERIQKTTGIPITPVQLNIVWYAYRYVLGSGLDRNSALLAYETTIELGTED